MAFTATPLDGSTTPIPMSSAVPDGTNTPVAVEAGPSKSSGGNTIAPVASYLYDGYNVTQGTITDAAVVGDNSGTVSAKLRGLSKIFNSVWDSVNNLLHVDIKQIGGAAVGIANPLNINAAVNTALTTYGSNPTQTAASGADTQYKFGAGGTTSFTRCAIQNNTGITIYYAFDQSSVTAGNEIYTLSPGAVAAWERNGTIIHFASASPQNFGGQAGITVEAFA